MKNRFKETYDFIKCIDERPDFFSDYDWKNILDALLFTSENKILHNYKVGQKIEFTQEGMDPLLHGKIIAVHQNYVTVKCKNGCHRYPGIDNIIRVMN